MWKKKGMGGVCVERGGRGEHAPAPAPVLSVHWFLPFCASTCPAAVASYKPVSTVCLGRGSGKGLGGMCVERGGRGAVGV